MDPQRKRIAILAAEFNAEIVEEMIQAAQREAADAGAAVTRVVRVPGCYEIPLPADALMAQEENDALVVLGFIERGETLHGEVMGHVVHRALIDLELKRRKPVGIGIIGPGATAEQAQARKSEYARAAVRAALRSLEVLGGR